MLSPEEEAYVRWMIRNPGQRISVRAHNFGQTLNQPFYANGGIVFNAAGSIAGTNTFIEADGAGGDILANVPTGKLIEGGVNGVYQTAIGAQVFNVYHTSTADDYPSFQAGDGFVEFGPGGTTPLQVQLSETIPQFHTNYAALVTPSISNSAGLFGIAPSGTSTTAQLIISQNSAQLGNNHTWLFEGFGTDFSAGAGIEIGVSGTASAVPLGFMMGAVEAFRITTTPDLQVPTALRMWTGSATSLTIAPSTGSLSKLMTLGGGTAPTTVSLTSGTAYTASTTQNMIITVGGGVVTAIAINGITTGLTSGTFYLKANDSITVTFSTAPTVLQMVA